MYLTKLQLTLDGQEGIQQLQHKLIRLIPDNPPDADNLVI